MSALTSYCPSCWIETEPEDRACPSCGFRMAAFDALGYEGKLLLALKHPIPEKRMLAIEILGEIRCRTAVPVFATIVEDEEDPYALRAIAQALARIGGDASRMILARLNRHRWVIVHQAAAEALRATTGGDPKGQQ